MLGIPGQPGWAARPQRIDVQAMVGSAERVKHLQESFEQKLQNVKHLDDFVALLSAQPPEFFAGLYLQKQQAVFEEIAKKFKDVALPEVAKKQSAKFKKIARGKAADKEIAESEEFVHGEAADKDRKNFTKLMRALPLIATTDPSFPAVPIPITLDLFDLVPSQTLEDCYQDIFYKWLAVWPVTALALPNKFSRWLSGGYPGATTSDEDLKTFRALALELIYDRWLDADVRNQLEHIFQPKTYEGFSALVQLVPQGFWYWQDPALLKDPSLKDPDLAGGPSALETQQVADYLDKRARVWGIIHTAWQGVRTQHGARSTGWIDFPFFQIWSLANGSYWPKADDIANKYPDHLKEFEKFRQSRRGRIWA